MSAKTERFEVRADPQTKERITQAAQMQHASFSGFILDAAASEADRVLARADHTLMPADQFDALMASLDVADHAPKLAEVAKQPRRFVRK